MKANKPKIRGLTLHRPWGFAIAHLDKRVENRTWYCWLDVGDYIAIHNGSKWDGTAGSIIRGLNHSKSIPNPTPESEFPGLIIAVARFAGNVQASRDKWFCGPVGWCLDSVVAIEPVRCVGQRGLWVLPKHVLDQVRINFKEAIA